jgi:hypothetical protein
MYYRNKYSLNARATRINFDDIQPRESFDFSVDRASLDEHFMDDDIDIDHSVYIPKLEKHI